jgi:hypothetical protein
MRIPIIEAAFSHPWTAAARRVLPSPSPQFTATAIWGPLLGWCVLELLAESIDADAPAQRALDLFDRLRLRESFAQAFGALGFEGEESWRVAARIKVVLLSEAGIGKPAAGSAEEIAEDETAIETFESESPAPEPKGVLTAAEEAEETVAMERVALPPALWLDPDVRWLTGVHEAEGHAYLVRERYEEMLWWLLMPQLLRLAGEPALDRAAIDRMGTIVDEALASAEAAGYRIDRLMGMAVEQKVEAPESSQSDSRVEAKATTAKGRETDPAEVASENSIEPV